MTWWLGSEFASHTTQVVELLMVGAWINGIAFIPYSLLQGQGRPDMVAKLHALELPPFVIALWLLLNSFGLPGAALAWCGRVAIDAAVLFKLARLRSHQLIRLIPALGLVLASYLIAHTSNISPLYRIVFAGAGFLGVCGLRYCSRCDVTEITANSTRTPRKRDHIIAANARTRPRKMNPSDAIARKAGPRLAPAQGAVGSAYGVTRL